MSFDSFFCIQLLKTGILRRFCLEEPLGTFTESQGLPHIPTLKIIVGYSQLLIMVEYRCFWSTSVSCCVRGWLYTLPDHNSCAREGVQSCEWRTALRTAYLRCTYVVPMYNHHDTVRSAVQARGESFLLFIINITKENAMKWKPNV